MAKVALLPNPDEPLSVLFLNTLWADRDGVHDVLDDGSGLTNWLAVVAPRLPTGAQPKRVPAQDATAFRQLRDALRQLAADRTKDPRHRAVIPASTAGIAEAARIVNDALALAPALIQLSWPGGKLTRAAPPGSAAPAAALSAIAADGAAVLSRAQQDQLRACLAPGCVMYFVQDHPRREWCSTACGNRARAARHYARHKTSQPS